MKLISHERKTEGARDDWETPLWLFKLIDEVFGFDCDVAASDDNHKVERFITEEMDALSLTYWGYRNWCNPPYSRWAEFAERALFQTRFCQTTVMLIPPRPDTIAWHRYCMQADEIIFIEGRISFLLDGEEKKGNGAGSCLVVFRPTLYSGNKPGPRISSWKPDRDYRRAA